MTCLECIQTHYRGRLAPIVMLPKEFAGTIIKVTKSGVIKSIKAVESSARGLTFKRVREAGPREAVRCLHNPLPLRSSASTTGETPDVAPRKRGAGQRRGFSRHPTSSSVQPLMAGRQRRGLSGERTDSPLYGDPSRRGPAPEKKKVRGVNDG